jgi:type IV pilus assembly protein PilN
MKNKGYLFVNLLPYREQIKKEQIKQFSLLMGLFAIVASFILFLIYSLISLEVDAQKSRNQYIETQNKKLDQDIKSIASLKDEIKETLAKRKVVEDLQVDRSDAVSILNALSLQLPEATTLKSISQSNQKITIVGTTTSNNKVSSYMTNLSNTDVFINPELIEVKSVAVTNRKQNARVRDDQSINEFTITVNMKPKVAEEEDNKEKLNK